MMNNVVLNGSKPGSVENSMGCCSSNVVEPLNNNQNGIGKGSAPKDAPISSKDADIIMNTWKAVESDCQGYGLVLFRRLFEQHPDIRTKFYFTMDALNDIEAIMADERLATHAKGVMDTISVAVSMLSDLGALVPILKQLGSSHAKFDLQPAHFQAVGGALLWTLASALGSEFNEEARNAWSSLFSVVTATMTAGIADAAKV